MQTCAAVISLAFPLFWDHKSIFFYENVIFETSNWSYDCGVDDDVIKFFQDPDLSSFHKHSCSSSSVTCADSANHLSFSSTNWRLTLAQCARHLPQPELLRQSAINFHLWTLKFEVNLPSKPVQKPELYESLITSKTTLCLCHSWFLCSGSLTSTFLFQCQVLYKHVYLVLIYIQRQQQLSSPCFLLPVDACFVLLG